MRGRPITLTKPTANCPLCSQPMLFEKVRRREPFFFCEDCEVHYKRTEVGHLIEIRKKHEKPTPYTADEFEESFEPRQEVTGFIRKPRWDRFLPQRKGKKK